MPETDIKGENIEMNSSNGGSSMNMKRNIKDNASPISPLSPKTPSCGSIDFAMHNFVDNSHEQLYQSICDMECSDESQSIQDSFTTYGNESTMDSELQHLAGANNYGEEEGLKEVGVEEEREKIPQCNKNMKDDTISKGSKLEGNKANDVDCTTQKPPIGKSKNSSKRSSRTFNASGGGGKREVEKGLDNPDLGPYLLKKARDIICSGDNTKRVWELMVRAKKSFESCTFDKPNLDYVMCLHMLASIHCGAGKLNEAIPLLEQSIEIPRIELGQNHALAKFVGCMQLGDIYATKGDIEKAIDFYKVGLEIQKEVLGDKDTRFGETCRYVAEAYIQAFEFDEAEKLCQMALDIHKVNGLPPSIEEASNRRLMGLICESKGNYEAALEHYVSARMGIHCSGQVSVVANIDCNIGDAYLALGRYDEAIVSYEKALASYKSSKGKRHPTVASVFVRLGELYNKVGKFGKSKWYCESALEIYNKPPPSTSGTNVEDIANGLTDLASIYESMNEIEQALNLLHKALELNSSSISSSNITVPKSKVAGIEVQIGVIHFMLGNYIDSYSFLKSAVVKFQVSGEKVSSSSLYAITLNQLGLACVKLYKISEAAHHFDQARSMLERQYGLFHPDTLAVYTNLAATYDALGSWDDAIELLEFVVVMREEKLGTADPVVDDEKRRLTELLSDAGKARRYSKSLETLFDKFSNTVMTDTKTQFYGM
ncbi:Protein KINESIN LIGHT CHAIN-RELATED 2 [Bienertia sinuspersici]